MGNSRPLLSICIATLNRARELADTLRAIDSVAKDIEIVIVDSSAAPSLTEKCLADLALRFSVSYYHTAVARGVDADFFEAAERSSGDYVWLMPDDDLLCEGAVDTVCRQLRISFPDILVANASVFDPDLKQMLRPSLLNTRVRRTYYPGQESEFFLDCAAYLTYIGGLICRRSRYLSECVKIRFGTSFAHLAACYDLPISSCVNVIAEPCIKIRFDSWSWRTNSFYIWMHCWPTIIASLSTPSLAAKRAVRPGGGIKFLGRLLLARANRNLTAASASVWVRKTNPNVLTMLSVAIVLLFPPRLLRFPIRLYYKHVRCDPLTAYTLRNSKRASTVFTV